MNRIGKGAVVARSRVRPPHAVWHALLRAHSHRMLIGGVPGPHLGLCLQVPCCPGTSWCTKGAEYNGTIAQDMKKNNELLQLPTTDLTLLHHPCTATSASFLTSSHSFPALYSPTRAVQCATMLVLIDACNTMGCPIHVPYIYAKLNPPFGFTPFTGFCLLPPALGTSTVTGFFPRTQLKFTSLCFYLYINTH